MLGSIVFYYYRFNLLRLRFRFSFIGLSEKIAISVMQVVKTGPAVSNDPADHDPDHLKV